MPTDNLKGYDILRDLDRSVLCILTTNNYKALKLMYDRRSVEQKGTRIVSITLREIGEQLSVSKPTAINIMKALRESNLIIPDIITKGRYYITDAGECIIHSFEANFVQNP